ncbi:hypothetical protein [Achromobacter xylosoxidans]|uniref:Uncharacterized protein n=1 Tax=Alcaligenes xylosoxydans xylosoxydans TaxID=85698 RepID=A0A1R1JVT0_ALCXX|nr:hypothetical protein [Achromobacter xylosoxidans]OMG89725.1 hypothetical protein BIZ92_23200 [Achromobacter xylosoxidans]BEG78470.1 hypothetical protein HBIAX_05572 [Achromobacter xylosoxidans]
MDKFLRLVLPAPDGKPGLQSCHGAQLCTADGQPIAGLIDVKLEATGDSPFWRATLVMDINVSGKPA